MKALQRTVWSLIFLGFGVRLVKAEEAGKSGTAKDERKRPYQTPQVDFPWKRMLHWRTCEGEKVEGTLEK